MTISRTMIEADPDDGISTDELMTASGLTSEGVRAALYDLERLGIASNDTVLTAFLHAGVERSSRRRFEQATALERALIDPHAREGARSAKGRKLHVTSPHCDPASQGRRSQIRPAGISCAG